MTSDVARPVAVVGLSCRLPGAADPRALWSLLREGRDAIADTPAERWALQGVSDPEDVPAGLRRGGFLDQVDRFDARFFGIAPREAAAMDPQQRLALELCWEALEDAGIAPGALQGSQTGIYVGAIASDYAELAQRAGADAVARQAFTGTQRSIIANRVSYALGLRGPSMTVDTGQSSSLVAVHLACQSLRSGESTLALAGGVQLNLGLGRALALEKLGALSPDGRCFTFDARANGFVRGEGGGVVVLKPLDLALADGDPIYCVIRGSAVNNDGGGDGLTAPDPAAQEALLQAAYRQAGIAVSDVQYVELHGTGTPLGDRVEATALGAVLGAGRTGRPLAVGSAKTNVGHLEAGAGVVGLLKVALAIEHGELPASLNFERPNPEIALDALGLRVPTSAEPWPEAHVVAGVSSFGIGGTNCHVVVEAPPAAGERADAAPSPDVVPWVVSGRSRAAVRANAGRLADAIAARPEAGADDVARALVATRTVFEHRAVALGETREELLEELRAQADGRPSARVIEGTLDPALAAERPVFVFPGQGGQWAGMGAELLERSPDFAAGIRACDEAIAALAGFSVEDVLRGAPDAPSADRIEIVQPVLFALMVALARMWLAAGVRPAAVVGHSQGEIAAAHIAGALSLEDAARIIVVRSRALSRIVGAGGMLSVGLSLEDFERRARPFGDRMTVAAINAPRSLVVSGDPEALEQLAGACEADGVSVRRIQSTVPGHSPAVEAVRDEVLDGLAAVAPRAGDIPVYSTVTGERIDTAAMDAGHWYRNLRQTVRFAPAIGQLLADGTRTFIEVGPHPVLTVPVEALAEEVLGDPGRVAVLATLRRDQGGPERLNAALAELYVRGGAVDWSALLGGGAARGLRLPTYAFQRERHWIDGVAPAVAPALGAGEPEPEEADEREPSSSFAARVVELAEGERGAVVLDAILGEAAAVLGHRSGADVDARLTFKELGFDSPAVVELRNRVNALTGLRLPSSALFDVPTPARLAERVLADLVGAVPEARPTPAPARTDEPLAIVGMACRYPGGVASPEDLWDLVAEGRDAIGAFPADRGWDLARLFDPDGDGLGTSYVDRGGFLYDAGEFDAEHFGISPREALAMDPQQRLLLECTWEALEDAGIDPSRLRGSATGVFAGVMSQEYGPPLHEPDDRSAGYALTGTGTSVVSGRVSYVLGLEGPAVSVDTACSSSLVALHLACQALRAGECDLALAGGASVMATPGVFVEFSRQRGLSPDGRCRAFGAGANGTGWSEGAGVLVLERLSVAQERGHRVLAVVRGTATNQDGASNGLTAPSGASQERVIRAALAGAGLTPADVDAVEAHGTGTALGDPIEAQALLATYGRERAGGPAYLGSLKSNIGHTQAAAGVGGVIKMVQALRHGQLPRTLWADEPSPHVDWDAGELRLLDEPVPWPAGERVRRAAVSSFGMSGTNAHVVLEEAPAVAAGHDAPEIASRVLPFAISASGEAALSAQAQRLAAYAGAHAEPAPAAVAASLALGRAQLSHRAVALAGGLDELADALGAFARGEVVESVVHGVARRDRRVAFVFPGQGGQWEGMAAALWDASPVFAQHMRACAEALAEFVDWSLEDVLRGVAGAPSLDRVDVVQPALWAVMVSLARLWESFGVRPAAVVGHSQGEIAAAHIAGALTLQDAARVVAVRSGVLSDMLSGLGGMVAVGTGAQRAAEYLEDYEGRVSLAAVNSPNSVVVSGELEGLHDLIARCEADGVPAKLLPVDYAAHSAQIEVMRERLLEAFAPVAPRAADVPLYSTVDGGRIDTSTMDAEYWYTNLRRTVRFDEAVRAMAADGIDAIVETGPHPVLSVAVAQTLEAAGHDPEATAVIGSLRRADGGLERFIHSLAEAHVTGIDVDWGVLLGGAPRVPLPTYAFQRSRYWLTASTAARDPSALGQAPAQHPLLDATVALAGGQGTVFTGRLSLERHPWLADHVVMGQVLLPATALLELALHAGAHSGAPVIDELTLSAPLAIAAGQTLALQVAVGEADEDGRRHLTIHSRADGEDAGWTQHAAATLATDGRADDDAELQRLAGQAWPPADGRALGGDDPYDQLADAGYEYGPAFQGLAGAWRQAGRIDVQAALVEGQEQHAAAYGLHPALLDAVLQAAVLGVIDDGGADAPVAPFSFSGVRLHGAQAAEVRATLVTQGSSEARIAVVDAAGAPVLTIDAFTTRPLDRGALQATGGARADALHEVAWEAVTAPAAAPELRVTTLGPGEALDALSDADVVLWEATAPQDGADPAAAIRALTERTLALLQAWLAAEPLAAARLVVVTRGGVTVADDEAPDLAQAAVVGLLRSAHSEHPDRFAVLDLDEGEPPAPAALAALARDESVIAVRDGALLVPRLVHVAASAPRVARPLDPDGTVLITGGTGGLGAMLATHLAGRHGARHLLLASRSGADAPGASELVASLAALGCEATVARCDVTDRTQVEQLLAAIPAEHPLTAVAHLAGAFDDGVIAAQDADRLRRVMHPKVDPAIHLDELTREHDLAEFLLYSSVAATLGLPGQSNYAAANAVLDALAQRRRAEGLPGLSLGLGVWQTATALTRRLTADGAEVTRAAGMVALPDDVGLALVDEARTLDRALVLPVLLDRPGLRAQAKAGVLAPVLRRLFGAPARTGARAGGSFAAKLAAAPEGRREGLALDLVREHLAAVLSLGSPQAIDEQRTFKELGVDSLSGVELRNRVAKATGLTLPATLVFDHPTPSAVARLLCERAADTGDAAAVVAAGPARADADDPIVIVGIGCRYPGQVRSAEDLWRLVAEGRDVIGDFPTDRGWNLERLFDPDPERSGTSRTRQGGFLYDAGDFDAEHFSISPREALTMDPQQRVLLECTWEALEHAGIDPLALRGSRTGVFAGVFESGYVSTNDAPELEGFRVLGGVNAAISGRVSYVLGLEGPAVSVDTACSSSLVALHLAAQALRGGECDLVLAGGVSVVANPELFTEFSRQGAVSPDGRCRAFGAGANGTGFSEGAGILVLERLSDAVRHGHDVLAVVRGSATNQDGASNGMAAPNGPSQERVIRAALANAGLTPADVDALEAHGTGTTLGDPIEAQALLATYGQERAAGPAYLGSLKSNIGHAQAAAGVAGVIKMVMALRHEQLPQTLHAQEPSPHVEWDTGELQLLTEPVAWPAGQRVRRAAVSAFGLSGTNAHVVLEEAPAVGGAAARHAPELGSRVLPFVISGSSEAGLLAQAERLAGHVAGHPELEPAAVAGTLALHRARLAHRAVGLVGGLDELSDALGAFARGEVVESVVQSVARRERRVGFVFPGQGGQWEGMAVALWDASPVFAQHMRSCAEALAEFVDWSLEDVLRGVPGAPSLQRVDVVQPALWAVMVSLARLWESFGVRPAAVVGHSQGEIAAAHIAGALTLQDAARVVALRSAVMSASLSGLGGMVAVGTGAQSADEYLKAYEGRVSLAAVNSPNSVVVSGELEGLHDLIARCEADGVPAKLLPVDYAAHSGGIETMRERLLEAFAPVAPRAADVPLYSTVTGERIDTSTMDAEYWYTNLRRTVHFDDAVRAMVADGVAAVIEAGPHPVLGTQVVETVEAAGHDADAVAVIGTLRRADGGLERFIRSLAEAHVTGVDVDWSALLGGAPRVALPTYAFRHQRYWLAPSGRTRDPASLGLGAADHPLLDASVTLAAGQGTVFTGRLSLERQPWLADHALLGRPLLPGTGFLDLALHAGAQAGAPVIEELTLSAPLLLPAGETVALQVAVEEADEHGRRHLTIHSRSEAATGAGWTLHASATLVAEEDAPPPSAPPPAPEAATEQDVDVAYDRLAARGYDYGPAFQALRHVAIGDEAVTAEVALDEPQAADADAHRIHPALADAVLQALALAGLDAQEPGRPEVPFSFSGVRLHRAGAAAARAWLHRDGGRWQVTVVDDADAPVLTIDAVAIRTIDARGLLTAAQPTRDALYEVRWEAVDAASRDDLVVAAIGEGPGDTYAGLAALEAALAAGAPVPDRVIFSVAAPHAGAGLLDAVHDVTERTLALLQAWLASEPLAAARLVVVTHGAVAAADGETPNLAHAAVTGLVRSAHSEHPERFALIDVDGTKASRGVLAAAAALDEPELAIRSGALRAPRLARAAVESPGPAPLPADGTVLITGGTSGLGALTARHLAERHGVRHLLLASRRGAGAPEAAQLMADLAQLGCEAEIVACDVSRRDEVQRLLAAIPAGRPLAAVVHAAGTLDDGVLSALDGERLRRVLAPKLDAAVHLDELTRELAPAELVLFSAGAGTLGSPGQANYAAANTFLDALAHARRAEGLPAVSLAFGFWERTTELTQHLTAADGRRLAPLDLLPMSDALGLALIDAARGADRAALAPMLLDVAALRTRAAAGLLPAMLSGVVPAGRARATAQGGSLARTLAAAPEADRDRVAADFVRGHVAAVLGHASADGIEADRPFKELGIDSLSAVELRNRLARTSGLTLPATLVFDHPTPAAVATLLRSMVEGRREDVARRPVRRTPVDEPIAIVGMACRYPGGVASPEDLWQLLVEGRDAIGEIPADRGWDVQRLFDPAGERPGTISARHGGFLEGAAGFDAAHFGISPREALAMDPQQRLMLECSWEALESAGIDPLSLRGSGTGVFVGAFDSNYGTGNDVAELEGYRMLGVTTSAGAGRVSYVLGLEGPAVSVDTACSSSLVAVHLGCQALRAGESDLVLAGGVTLMATPELFVELSRQRGLSPDGRCRAFGAEANGAGFSDGVGVLVLERLSVARERGHRVLALVRGSAVNQDGASNGFAAPNGPSQERVIRAALANAGLTPGDVDAVEAHGTGTTLGDPIEAQALLATYGQERAGAPAYLGSLKSNIGHTQAAAGVGGVIKMVQALRHEQLPRTLWADRPSPHVDWDAGALELLDEPVPWPAGERPRRAGISSFGMSGTNSHLIIEEPPADEAAEAAREIPSRVLPFLLSASSEAGLAGQAQRLGAHVEAHPELEPAAVAGSLALGRAQLSHRAVAVVGGLEELNESLAAFVRGEFVDSLIAGNAPRERRVAFVFPGQGGQWEGMAVALWDASPVFAQHMRACADALAEFVDWSLEDVLRGAAGAPSLERIEIVQPALFAIMVSLARLWESFGVRAAAVAGHSQGEIAAAHIAGALSLQDATRIVVARSRALSRIAGAGGMLSVGLSLDELAQRTEGLGGRVTIAAVNAPRLLVVSGDPEALEQLATGCEADGVPVRRIASTVAGHSPHVEAVRDEVLEAFGPVAPQAGSVPLFSTVTGARLDTAAMDAEHWYRNLRQTVRFEPAVRELLQTGVDALIEIGPHPVLTTPLTEILSSAGDPDAVAVIGTLRRADGGLERIVRSLAEAHVAGVAVDWTALFGPGAAARASLPTYAFQHRRYWLAPGSRGGDPTTLGQAPGRHPLLDASIALADGEGTLFTGRLSLERHPWLADHVVLGRVVLPEAVFADLALHAGAQSGAPVVEDLAIAAPLVLAEAGAVALQVTVSAPDADGRRTVTIHSRPDEGGTWTRHAAGTVVASEDAAPEPIAVPERPDAATAVDFDELYDRLEHAGVECGAAFQRLTSLWEHDGEVVAQLALPEGEGQEGSSALHPAVLDAALQPAVLLCSERADDGPVLVERWDEVRLTGRGAPAGAHLRIDAGGGTARVVLADADGRAVASVRATLGSAAAAQLGAADRGAPRDALLHVAWQEAASPQANGARYMLLGSPNGLALDLEAHPDLGSVAAAVDPAQHSVAIAFADFHSPAGEEADAGGAHAALHRAVELLQAWLADERLTECRLVVATRGAVAAAEGDSLPDLAAAAVWGLVRSAQSEHPDRIVLVDVDESDATREALLGAVTSGEPQIALRDGRMLVPRLAPVATPAAGPDLERAAQGTVLVVGGTSGVGAVLARHLVRDHGVRHLLLTSRRGAGAPGAQELVAELSALGATVEVAACDVGNRAEVASLLGGVPAERPLSGVVHAAVVTDNSLVESMDPEQLDRVLAPKVDGALHLHQLTQDLDLGLFVLCSSMAATFGGPGQGNYAAANAFLDALAEHRRARGLVGVSVQWGLWSDVGQSRAVAGKLEQSLGRLSGSAGFRAFPERVGLRLFDAALAADLPVVIASPYRREVVRQEARAATAPRILSALVESRARHAPAGEARRRPVVEETRAQIAAALGYESLDTVQLELSFLELGFDSLVSLELRKRLQAVMGIKLPATVLFDHPTPAALIEHLRGVVGDADGDGAAVPAPSPVPAAAAGGNGTEGSLSGMFRRAHQLGKLRDGMAIAEAAAGLRPRFGVSHVNDQAPDVIPLSSGDQGPVVFCIPSLVASSGPHEYARFARPFQGRREVVAVPVPGFGPGGLLAARLDAVAGAQAVAIERHAGDRPIALVGFSTGGLLAHAVAAELARMGRAPESVVLIDSYTMETAWAVADLVIDRMLAGDGEHPAVDDERLAAMGAYLGMLDRWSPPEPVAPTLLVKATDPVPGMVRTGDWTATWAMRHAAVEVPGSHLTVLEDHVETTARAVEDWLARDPADGPRTAAPRRRLPFRAR